MNTLAYIGFSLALLVIIPSVYGLIKILLETYSKNELAIDILPKIGTILFLIALLSAWYQWSMEFIYRINLSLGIGLIAASLYLALTYKNRQASDGCLFTLHFIGIFISGLLGLFYLVPAILFFQNAI